MKLLYILVCTILAMGSLQMKAVGTRQDDSLALVAFYQATNGSNWIDTANWLTSKPIDQWSGIRVNSSTSRVDSIFLYENNLIGTIPKEIGNLTGLIYLDLSNNSLKDSLPVEMGNLKLLTDLYVTSNELTGAIPKWIKNFTNLDVLALGNNIFTGSIPVEIGDLVNLRYLYLWGNQLSGEIPKEIAKLSNLRFLELEENNLEGLVPKEFVNLYALYHFDLSTNYLTGSLPDIWNLLFLNTVILSNNEFSGTIPADIKLGKLQGLYLGSNKLTGSIPKSLGDLAMLKILRLEANQLTGEIPKELGNLTALETLYLRSNQLTGNIPNELGKLKNLKYFSLRANKLTGSIPAEFSGLTSLKFIILNDNLLTSGIGNLPKIQFDSVFIHNNRFTFDALTDTVSAIKYVYSPQDSLGVSYDTILAPNQAFRLGTHAGSSTKNQYKWFKNGIEIPAAASNEYLISSLTKMDEGVYTYQVTNSAAPNLTLFSRPITVKVEGSAGVDENAVHASLTIQPNPVSNIVTINIGDKILSPSLLGIYNQIGHLVKKFEINDDTPSYRIDVSDLATGMYMLRTQYGENRVSRAFVICR